MKKFGLACEGVTDKATIRNILCGYFSIKNPADEIGEPEAPFGQTDGGGWRPFLQYLTLERFQDDFENFEFLILHIDTDVSKDFDVPHKDEGGNLLSAEVLVENIISKLKEKINEKESGVYEEYADKIIFAISVHSIECWLLVYYAECVELHDCSVKVCSNSFCFNKLKSVKFPKNTQLAKKRHNYDVISEPFSKRKNIDAVAQKDPSFHIFIQSLAAIELP